MAELQMINVSSSSSGSLHVRTSEPLVMQLATGLEKIGLAMKSRSWRREGRAGLGPFTPDSYTPSLETWTKSPSIHDRP